MKKRKRIAFLSDFGLSDGYVAAVKGVILSLSPDAEIIDISHSVKSQNVDEAAYLLWTVFSFFPKSTIFVCVVDPGVGTDRRILCVKGNDYYFLAPDNGLLKFILGTLKTKTIVGVTNHKYYRHEVSRTFHGRDIFAPVAAHLANGRSIHDLGPKVIPLFGEEQFVKIASSRRTYTGRIIHADHFGNIITNFVAANFPKHRFRLQIGNKVIHRSAETYQNSVSRTPFIIVGSSGLLEVSVKNGNAARALSTKIHQQIYLEWE